MAVEAIETGSKIKTLGCEPENPPQVSQFVRTLETRFLTSFHKQANMKFYDGVAPQYANERAWTTDTRNSIRENLIRRVNQYISDGDKILVVGTGTGSDQEILQEIGAVCYGIDLSRLMLIEAKRRINDHLVQAEADEIPFPTDFFNFVYCEAAAEHFDGPFLSTEFIPELTRVLVPNQKRANLLLSVRLGNGKVYRISDKNSFKYFATYTQETINRILTDAGVEIVEQWCSQGGTPSVEGILPWFNTIGKIR
ncbi:hypothetical protein A3A66_02565 [Microgenomates group bacterium RIFCSPLOWO2_01_FULL_46_13]|nr:MAG: hypothetical protein A2783_03180 [Microgenomates group bacterium RIFCSPHIGHO2_01_FULL_45_11]OGV94854.1 MAG: hypothetical protein A3A66_02565 [Microgenomates group bacterium RIFCSPLOWO2_01_FULL_46_13]